MHTQEILSNFFYVQAKANKKGAQKKRTNVIKIKINQIRQSSQPNQIKNAKSINWNLFFFTEVFPLALKPNWGWSDETTEIWIRGKGFHNKLRVFFGSKEARMVETEENFMTVLAPPQPPQTVEVYVGHDTPYVMTSQKPSKQPKHESHKLYFTYRAKQEEWSPNFRMSDLDI